MSNADAISTVVGLVYYLFVLGINLGTTILVIVAKWKINQKANEPGWAAIVPYYGQYVLFKIAGKAKLFWVTLVLSIVKLVYFNTASIPRLKNKQRSITAFFLLFIFFFLA